MKITVFGASGAIGQQFIALATQHGHAIRAVYRTMPPISSNAHVEILVNSDIFDRDFVMRAIHDADVVVSTLGPNFTQHHNALSKMISPKDLHQRLAHMLAQVVKEKRIPTKVIAVSTGSMGPADSTMGLGPRLLLGFFRTFVARNLRVVGQDLGAMEREFDASGIDWYAVRPVKLTDGPLTEHVQARDRFIMRPISRADVAWYLLSLAEDPKPRQQRTPIIVAAQSVPEKRHKQNGKQVY